MTIAAGFHFKGGILVCADSQFSSPSVKFYESKLSHIEMSNWKQASVLKLVFAMSGTDGYMQMAVEECERAVVALFHDDGSPSKHDVKNALSNTLIKLHNDHLYPHPRYGYADGPSVSLIVGVWLPRDGCTLYWTSETTVNFIFDYKFIGSGGGIGAYSVGQIINRPWMAQYWPLDLKDIVLLTAHALRAAKESDPYCGGESDFAALHDGGSTSAVARFDIESIESYSETFQNIIRNLFFAAADLDQADEKVVDALELSAVMLKRIRNEQKQSEQHRVQLIKLLSSKQ